MRKQRVAFFVASRQPSGEFMSELISALLRQRLITAEQLQDARDKQLGSKKPLVDVLVEMGFIKESDLLAVYSEVFRLPIIDPDKQEIDAHALARLPCDTAKRYGVFPLRIAGDVLTLGTSNPFDLIALDDIKLVTGMRIETVLCPPSGISRLIDQYYHLDDTLYDFLKNIPSGYGSDTGRGGKEEEKVFDSDLMRAEHSPIVRLTNLILTDAVSMRASDIHLEPHDDVMTVRYRIDGDLKNIMKVPAKMHNALVVRIKVLASLDISESRKPQDGRCSMIMEGRKSDIRISIVPTFFGEKIVLRLLDLAQAKIKMTQLGFQEDELDMVRSALTSPQGMILVTGPTGSGKTSTLYAALNMLKHEKNNIVTIEDPIEYLIGGVSQIQVNPAKDVTFANGLRSILRQDPNIILVGEIRDQETAEIAFRSSLTGHLVFSSLHTNSAISSITRLRDIGVEQYLLGSSLRLIIAQRLVKVVCPRCQEDYRPGPQLLERFGKYLAAYGVDSYIHGRGCPACDYSGYYGRTALFEILAVTEQIRALISQDRREDALWDAAVQSGFRCMAESGIKKVKQGITTLEEIARVTESGAEPVTAEDKGPSARELILIADDEADMRKILAKRLMDSGYEVMQAEDGGQAVEIAARRLPGLIIMDVMMPRVGGFDAVRQLRSRLSTAGIPIIMLTARKDKAGEIESFEAGADDYITKPFDKEKLLARIKMLLARRTRING